VAGVDVVCLLLTTLVAGMLCIELAVAVVLSSPMEVVVELVLFVDFVLVVLVVVSCKIKEL
jgi:hypothetical protein